MSGAWRTVRALAGNIWAVAAGIAVALLAGYAVTRLRKHANAGAEADGVLQELQRMDVGTDKAIAEVVKHRRKKEKALAAAAAVEAKAQRHIAHLRAQGNEQTAQELADEINRI